MSATSARRILTPIDGDTKRCPHCHQTLVFNSRYPILAARLTLGSEAYPPEPVRHEPAWVCRNGGCGYRELVGSS